MKKILYTALSLVLLTGGIVSCGKDSLDPKIIDREDITTNPISSATQLGMVVNGAYKAMMNVAYYGRDYVIYNEVHSDNAISNANSNRFTFETDFKTQVSQAFPADTWSNIYKVVALANVAINADITSGDQTEINNYRAEAYALRALAHFDLMKLYGQQNVTRSTSSLTVPYITQYGDVSDENYVRLTLSDFRTKVYEDIDQAIALANNDITIKTKFNLQSINVLKARLAMYFAPFFGVSEYDNADTAINQALALGGNVATAVEFKSIFALGEVGVNSVFELQFLDNDNLGNNSLANIYNKGAYGDINTVEEVKNILFADTLDIRGQLVKPVDNILRNVGKYGYRADNVKLMRFEEIVLIAAEVSFRKGNAATAATLINSLVSKRGITTTYTSADITLDIILTERRKELIFEGFRFDDLMRLQIGIPVINERALENTPAYGDTRLAFPIPQVELNVSSIPQNQGY